MADPRRWTWVRFVAPALIAAYAVWTGATALLHRPYAETSAAVALQRGKPNTLPFRTGSMDGYDVSLAFDAAALQRAFPCRFSPTNLDDPACRSEVVPLDFTLALRGPDGVVETKRYDVAALIDDKRHGESVTVNLGHWVLDGDTDYSLTLISNVDGTALSPARPRLSVDLDPFGRDGEAIGAGFGLLWAMALMAIAAIWGGVTLLLTWRGAKRSREGGKVAA